MRWNKRVEVESEGQSEMTKRRKGKQRGMKWK